MIDTSSWGEMRIGDYFEVEYGTFRPKDRLGFGKYNYVTTSGFNNGITDKIDVADHQGGCITVASDGALMGSAFYQEEPFSTSNIVSTLTPFDKTPLNKYNAQFICALIFSKRSEFGWLGFKFSVDRVRNLVVKVPITSTGEPDWDYMESYMKAVMEESEKSLENLRKADDAKHLIDVSGWGEFRVGDLFDIHPTKAYKLTNAQLLDDGDYPVIANSAYNNGIGGYSTKEPTENGNMVTFSDTVDANTIFYQKEPFVGYPHVQGLYPIKYEDKWNEYTYSFFVSVFRGSAISKGFDYGNKFRRDIAVDLIVKLPITSTGEPDWQYMEDYMRRIMDKSEQIISDLQIGA